MIKRISAYIFGLLIVIAPFIINFIPYRTRLFDGFEFYVTFLGPIVWLLVAITFIKLYKPRKWFIVLCVILLPLALYQMVAGIVMYCALFPER